MTCQQLLTRVSLLFLATMACARAPNTAASTSTIPASPAVTTVILVRHAEKVDNSSDPELSAAGVERANTLVEVVKQARVSSIITTQFRRTRATAAPAAAALGVVAQVIPASGAAHAREVADTVRARAGVSLIVGHSNTVPAIIAALGATAPAPICDSEYDDLFVVTLPADGRPAIVVRTRYGAVSPRGVGCPPVK